MRAFQPGGSWRTAEGLSIQGGADNIMIHMGICLQCEYSRGRVAGGIKCQLAGKSRCWDGKSSLAEWDLKHVDDPPKECPFVLEQLMRGES